MAVRCALYVRHSTDKSKTENQKPDVEQVARARGFEVVATFEEGASAVKKRPEYERMMKAAKRGAFDVLVVCALDRFGRSMVGNLTDVLELDRIGVKVVSVRETWLDTLGPVRNLLVAIFSWCAEQERNRLVERTKAGVRLRTSSWCSARASTCSSRSVPASRTSRAGMVGEEDRVDLWCRPEHGAAEALRRRCGERRANACKIPVTDREVIHSATRPCRAHASKFAALHSGIHRVIHTVLHVFFTTFSTENAHDRPIFKGRNRCTARPIPVASPWSVG